LIAVIALKLRLNDEALICGTLIEALGELDAAGVLDPLLPQPAASRAAHAAAAVRLILLLLRNFNETPSLLWARRAT
jgi:hypothetical protein